MLEKYIEKNIFRKVYICEHVFEYQEIKTDEIANLLDVSLPTIQHDIECILEQLDYCIDSVTKDHHLYKILFKHGITRTELTQTIYSSSYFLRFLAHYFAGEFSSTQLVDNEFISLSKVYAVKKQILDFFKENNYLKEKQILIPEFDIRNLLLALTRYIDWQGYEQQHTEVQNAIEEVIQFVEKNFFDRRYCIDERKYITRGIEIAMGRVDFPLTFPKIERQEAEKKPLFQLVKTGLAMQKNLHLQEADTYFIFSLFNSRNYTNSTIDLFKKDFAIVYKSFVQKNPFLQELVVDIAAHICALDSEDEIFQQAFLQLMRTTWADGQVFLPESLQILTPKQKELYTLILEILENWRIRHNFSIRWNCNLISKFTKSIYVLLQKNCKCTPKEIFIVSDNSFKQMYYRQRLMEVVHAPHKVNVAIYHSLAELKNEFLYSCERIVLCDASVYQSGQDTKKTVILPISLRSTDQVISELTQKLALLG